MTSLSYTTRNRRLNEIRTNLKQVPLITTLTKKLVSINSNSISNSSISAPQCNFQQQTNSTPSEMSIISGYNKIGQNSNTFYEKYDLFEKIGQGSNGCVYRCQHKNNKKIYAVKKFKVSEEQLTQIKRNFIQIEQLSHHSICSYKALYFDNNHRFAFLVMDYFPLPNLEEYTVQTEQQIKIIAKQIILALRYLHFNHICHRDIKPSNILYDCNTKKIKIIDFGISKKTFQKGVRRDMLTIIGTSFYFAPEIYLGGGYDERVDIWALGITIYKLIAGYTPFESKYHSDTIKNILKGEFTFDSKIWDGYSPFAKDFFSRILKPRNLRMDLNQCEMHFWFDSIQKKSRNLRRQASYQYLKKEVNQNPYICENTKQMFFQKENSLHFLNRNFEILKKIKSLQVNEFDLQDNDEQLPEIKTVNNSGRRMTI